MVHTAGIARRKTASQSDPQDVQCFAHAAEIARAQTIKEQSQGSGSWTGPLLTG